MTEAIRTEHLKFSYDAQSESGGVTVFDDLNLSIEEGSFVAVLGHNGCGKSTLAKHFNAVLLPEGGSVQVFGIAGLILSAIALCIWLIVLAAIGIAVL